MEFRLVSLCFTNFGGMVGGMEPFFDPFPRISCPQMSLNTAQIRSFSGSDTPYKKADEKGLYLEVFPNGSKLWRFKYRALGKEKRIALGAWPEVGLSQARHMRDELRIRISNGEDPAMTRKREKALSMVSASNTFASVAQEYIDTKMIGEERAEATLKKARWFLDLLKPAIGSLPISDIDPQIMLAPLKRLEARGNRETAKKCRAFASRVFRYGAATGRCNADPTAILQGALVSPKARHYAAILEPGKLGELLRAIHAWDGPVATRYALKITPHVYVRPGELRHAEWKEFDFDKATWTIPEGKMKARRTHVVPLSKQVLKLFEELRELSDGKGYLFPTLYTPLRPMSENTVNVALRRLGFEKDEVTAHGFRSTASSFLNESGKWHPDAIERALAHGDSNAVRGIYNRGNYWDERVRMAQWWSNYLDHLRGGGKTSPESWEG
jgi:integrase